MPNFNVTIDVKKIIPLEVETPPLSGVTVWLFDFVANNLLTLGVSDASGIATLSGEYEDGNTSVDNWRILAKRNDTPYGGIKIKPITDWTGNGIVYLPVTASPPPPPPQIQVEVKVVVGGSTNPNGTPVLGNAAPTNLVFVALIDPTGASRASGQVDATGYALLSCAAGTVTSLEGWWVSGASLALPGPVGSSIVTQAANPLIGQVLIELRA